MDSPVTEIGVLGIFAWMVIKEILAWKAKPSNGNGNGNGKSCVTKSEFEEHKKSVQYKDNCTEIVKRIETEFRAIEERDRRRVLQVDENFKKLDKQFDKLGTLIRNGNG